MNELEKAIETALENSPAFTELKNIVRRIENIERLAKHPLQKIENNGIDTREFPESLRG